MTAKKILPSICFLFLIICKPAYPQKTNVLPRSTPNAEGVSSQGIIDFLDAAAKTKHEFHSIMIMKHGKVVAEGWWNPYRPDIKHTMYSCSKSFTATAVGFAVSEHLLNVNDKVISFFPNELPDTVSKYLAELTVKDVLMMSDGQEPDPTAIVAPTDNWVKSFLALPIVHEPGSTFLYNSAGTYMLSAIVQKVTGKKVIDYLMPRLFEPLGIGGIDWETDSRGINTGGWGLRLKTEDMAKFGQLFLQKGKWNGKQILPAEWVEDASTTKIIQHPDYSQAKRDSSDWEQGYCYQMWRCRHNAFRGDGAFGQYIIVMPDQDAVIAITSETINMQGELDLVWEYLLPALKNDKASANHNTEAVLKQRLASLSLPQLKKNDIAAAENSINGKEFSLDQNEKNIQSASFQFKNNICEVTFKTDTAQFELNFGSGKWQNGSTTMHGPYLVAVAKANLTGLPPFKIAGEYTWKDEHTLELVLRYIESPHTETITCSFDDKNIKMEFARSFSPDPKTNIIIKGSSK
ncbi:MAG TPA: serine hydrolase [Puia sp.]|nr:serine hydrolase [Puia sp.]